MTMNTDPDLLIHGYLDEILTDEQLRQLSDWIGRDPANARRFAVVVLLDDRLSDRFRSASLLNADRHGGEAIGRGPQAMRWRRGLFLSASAAVVLVAALLVLQVASSRRTQAAESELDRLIEVSRQAVDRTYRILSLNKPQPPGLPPDQDPRRVRPPIDGALLYTRGEDQHVLVRRYANGETFLTGSNGHESWAIPPDGPVQVSSDPTRYRGAAPGERQNVPFEIPEALTRLREAYGLQVEEGDARRGDFSRLIARKQSSGVRGPSRVELWFRAGSDVIERMRFEGLPSVQGGPLSLELQLIEQRDLGPSFFEHHSHHTADRTVNREP
jgi:hypothetical protein